VLPAHTMSKSKEFGDQPQQLVQREAKPHGSPERQPLPDVLDVLERRAQLFERAIARDRRKFSRAENSAFDKERRAAIDQLINELERLYIHGTNRDRLIMTTYATLAIAQHPKFDSGDSVILHTSLHPRKARAFISRVAPLSEDELREELRKAQEERERKKATLCKRLEYSLLPPDVAAQRRREAQRESNRRWRQRSKEEHQLQAEQQPTQLYPPSTQE
jgi:hypothetical protein